MLEVQSMPALEGHTSTVMGNSLIVYGGKTAPLRLNGDVFMLDIGTNVWRRLLVAGEAPAPRAYHTACRFGKKIYMFGGQVAVGVDDIHYNNYNVFANVDALPPDVINSTHENRFREDSQLRLMTQQRLESTSLFVLDLTDAPTWSRLATHGASPPTRAHHIACQYKGKMYIYGGYSCHTSGRTTDEEHRACYEVFMLDLVTNQWSQIDVSLPPPRTFGMSSVVFDRFWIVFGGVDVDKKREVCDCFIFHLDNYSWKRIGQMSVPPLCMSACCAFGDTMYVIAGSSDCATRFHQSIYCFDLLKGGWWVKSMPPTEGPPPHCKSTATVVGAEIYILGGLNTSFHRLDYTTIFAFNPTTSTWRDVYTKFDGDLAMNVWGVHRPLANSAFRTIGASGKSAVVSQGAQTSTDTDGGGYANTSAHSHHQAVASNSVTPSKFFEGKDVWSMGEMDLLMGLQDSIALTRRRSLLAVDQVVSTSTSQQMSSSTQATSPPSALRNNSDFAISVQREIEARSSRIRELTTADPAIMNQVHDYWKTELDHLSKDHARWRDASTMDGEAIRNTFVTDSDPFTIQGGLRKQQVATVMHMAAGGNVTSPVSSRSEAPMKLVMRAGYVSPSIQRLGLESQLYEKRERIAQRSGGAPTN